MRNQRQSPALGVVFVWSIMIYFFPSFTVEVQGHYLLFWKQCFGLFLGANHISCTVLFSQFYDFWLLVFNIITSCSALGVKVLILQFRAAVRKRRRTTFPRGLCGQRGETTSGKVTWCFSSLGSHPDRMHRLSTTVRPMAFIRSFSHYIWLASILIILYYSALSCIPIPYLIN